MFSWSIALGSEFATKYAATPFLDVGVHDTVITVTVTCCVTELPAEFVTVRVNVVVADKFPVDTGIPDVTEPTD
jgi:hypothetical protein